MYGFWTGNALYLVRKIPAHPPLLNWWSVTVKSTYSKNKRLVGLWSIGLTNLRMTHFEEGLGDGRILSDNIRWVPPILPVHVTGNMLLCNTPFCTVPKSMSRHCTIFILLEILKLNHHLIFRETTFLKLMINVEFFKFLSMLV